MELSKLQQNIIDKKNNKIVVISAAASGKTRLLTEKARQLLKNGIEPKEIAVITFTNMAAEELRQRLGEDYKNGIFIGTIHSLANSFLLSYGIDTSSCIKKEDFDELFQLVKKYPKCVRKIKYILLDEAQDSNSQQFEFIFNMIQPDSFFLAGDLKQCIYRWNGSEPELIEQLCLEPDVLVCQLNENYRNSQDILDFAKRLIKPTGLIDDSIPMRHEYGRVIEVPLSINAIARDIKKDGNYKDWAVLTRSNRELENVYSIFQERDIPCDTFKQGDLNKEQLTQKMNDNTVKILTIHSSKGLEWNKVVVVGAKYNSQEERNVCYVAATRARDLLVWTTKKNYKKQKLSTWE